MLRRYRLTQTAIDSSYAHLLNTYGKNLELLQNCLFVPRTVLFIKVIVVLTKYLYT